jgi:dihydrofolate reductase
MLISLIVAMDESRGIGKDGKIPWRLKADLRRFKELTMGHYLIMGRKTWESIGRQLPGRKLVILTHNPDYRLQNCAECLTARSLEQALDVARAAGEAEAFVAGGGQVFAQALPLAGRIYLTAVQTNADCDVFFPPIDLHEWVELERSEQPADAENEFASTFRLLQRGYS